MNLRFCTVSGNASDSGGGIGQFGGVATILNSTIAHNVALSSGGGIVTANGADLRVRNSTISGNRAGDDGGGIAAFSDSAALLIQNSTVAFNETQDDGGGIWADLPVTLQSTIVARNGIGGSGPDLFSVNNPGDLFTIQNCLIGDTTAAQLNQVGGNQLNVDPLLGPLANNGGRTLTHALQPGSPAINNGINPEGFTTDQRGGKFKRVKGGQADIGAFER
jgi:hypothetical protein